MIHRYLGHYALALAALVLAPSSGWAAAATATGAAPAAPLLFAAPVARQVMPGQTGSLVRVTVALILVLAAVFAAAWFSRRVHGVGSARSATLEVIAQLPLGARERAVLVRVGGQQVLLGVASGNVRTLHVMPSGEQGIATAGTPGSQVPVELVDAAQRPTFKAMLLKSLGK